MKGQGSMVRSIKGYLPNFVTFLGHVMYLEKAKNISKAAYRVALELGYDGNSESIHPMLQQAAYNAACEIVRKATIRARLFDTRSEEQKEVEAKEWLDNLTLSRAEWEAINENLLRNSF